MFLIKKAENKNSEKKIERDKLAMHMGMDMGGINTFHRKDILYRPWDPGQ